MLGIARRRRDDVPWSTSRSATAAAKRIWSWCWAEIIHPGRGGISAIAVRVTSVLPEMGRHTADQNWSSCQHSKYSMPAGGWNNGKTGNFSSCPDAIHSLARRIFLITNWDFVGDRWLRVASVIFLDRGQCGWVQYGFSRATGSWTLLGMYRDPSYVGGILVCVRLCVCKKTARTTHKSRGPLAWSSQDLKTRLTDVNMYGDSAAIE